MKYQFKVKDIDYVPTYNYKKFDPRLKSLNSVSGDYLLILMVHPTSIILRQSDLYGITHEKFL
ncbi:MAG: hypothetical protein IPM26_16460 [Saprospiraceae bacterium]|nr:hypothetical protein [Saprospiraceae bacterium]